MLKFSKLLAAVVLIAILGSIVFIGWHLSKRLPEIESPIMAVDHRIFSGPQLEEDYYGPPEWKREILSRFEEGDLKKYPESNVEVYRLVFLPSFRKPISIRIEHRSGSYSLIATRLNGTAGFGYGELGRRESERANFISKDDWLAFNQLIEDSRFWEMETIDIWDEPVNDGARWVLEAENGMYHRVSRITPSKKLRVAMLRMIELAGARSNYEGYFSE